MPKTILTVLCRQLSPKLHGFMICHCLCPRLSWFVSTTFPHNRIFSIPSVFEVIYSQLAGRITYLLTYFLYCLCWQWCSSSDCCHVSRSSWSLCFCSRRTVPKLFWADASIQPADGSTVEALSCSAWNLPTYPQGTMSIKKVALFATRSVAVAIAQMPDETDAKQILTASPAGNWRRPLGRPRITWMKTIQQDLKSSDLNMDDAVDLAQNRLLWRLMPTFGATHS